MDVMIIEIMYTTPSFIFLTVLESRAQVQLLQFGVQSSIRFTSNLCSGACDSLRLQ